MGVLHIFPKPDLFGGDDMEYMVCRGGQSITSHFMDFHREGVPLPSRSRDEMMSFITHPSVRAQYDDIIIHADPVSKFVVDTVLTVRA